MRSPDLPPFPGSQERLSSAHESERWQPLWHEPRSRLASPAPSAFVGSAPKPQQAIATLRQRELSAVSPSDRPLSSTRDFLGSSQFTQYLRELSLDAQAINDLSEQQKLLIERFKRKTERLSSMLMANGLPAEQAQEFCELRNTSIPWIVEKSTGKLVLTAQPIDIFLDVKEAAQNAQYLRRKLTEERSYSESDMHGENTSSLAGGRSLASMQRRWNQLILLLESRAKLTPLDLLVWGGGGVIGRVALQLSLAANPGLWPWVVGVTIAAVAIALYKLLFTPQQDISLVARLFLALTGLAIGGHFPLG